MLKHPDKPCKDTEAEDLILYANVLTNVDNCVERSMTIIKATAKAALESQPQE